MSTQVKDLLSRLIGFDTTSCRSNRGCIDFIRDYLDSHGVASTLIAGKEDGKTCLWATVGAADASGIVLAGHTDVVPVEGQKWSSDPFVLTERDDKFFGRGTADMKGFIACALAFVPEFLQAKTGGCFHLALTCDEETDMSGAQNLVAALQEQALHPHWVWIGEPTGFSIVDQHKGVAAFRTHMTGVTGHSGQPDKGVNAIDMAAQLLDDIRAVANDRRAKPYAPSRFEPPYTTVNMGMIAGGTAENIIAENCELTWQVRAHPGDSAQQVFAEVESRTRAALAAKFNAFPGQARMQSCTCFDIPPFFALPDSAGVNALKKALTCDHTQAVGFGTEAGIFQKLGAGSVICGPGFIEQAHQPDEFIDKKQLITCVDLMRRVLLSSCAR